MTYIFTRFVFLVFLYIGTSGFLFSQKINRFKTDEMELIYFGKRYSYLMPHVARTFHNALDFHKAHWNYPHKMTYVMLTDFEVRWSWRSHCNALQHDYSWRFTLQFCL